MQVIYSRCCGLDVHARTVVACLCVDGHKQTRTFSTMTDDLLLLSDWLAQASCSHVAIESTGVYWRPVFNLLEGNFEVLLVNAQHIKAVPGRKTDVRDCEWICDLLRHGLLKASFIPPPHIRDLRELTRHRQTLVRDHKAAQLKQALKGRLTSTQRFLLKELLQQYDQLQSAIERTNQELNRLLETNSDPFLQQAVELLQSIPGVGQRVAETIVSEIGTDMTRFASDAHLASWAGMCPGNHASAGKQLTGKTRKGNVYVRGALTQAAWAAARTKQTYLSAQFRRLTTRLGKKRALVAVGHSILVIVWHVLSKRRSYQELGGDYFDRRNEDVYRKKLIRKLEDIGLKVTVETVTTLSALPESFS